MVKRKIFLSYAFTGEDEAKVRARMRRVVSLLESNGHEVYCNLFDLEAKNYTNPRQYLLRAIEKMNDCGSVIVIQTSSQRSEGMLIEVGAAIARNKPILLAQHQSAAGTSYLSDLVNKTITWQSEDKLDVAITRLIC